MPPLCDPRLRLRRVVEWLIQNTGSAVILLPLTGRYRRLPYIVWTASRRPRNSGQLLQKLLPCPVVRGPWSVWSMYRTFSGTFLPPPRKIPLRFHFLNLKTCWLIRRAKRISRIHGIHENRKFWRLSMHFWRLPWFAVIFHRCCSFVSKSIILSQELH